MLSLNVFQEIYLTLTNSMILIPFMLIEIVKALENFEDTPFELIEALARSNFGEEDNIIH